MIKKMVLSLTMLLFVFSSIQLFSQLQTVKPKQQLKVVKKMTLKPMYRFEINGIKRILTTPTKVKFQVQYYISPNYPKACFLGARVPSVNRPNTKFSYRPAGRLPNGIPKGQKHFRDNIVVELNYNGKKPYTSKQLVVTMYDKDRKTLKTQVIRWGQKWGKLGVKPYRFDLQGVKRVLVTPNKVRFQVQYFISPHYRKPCFISAYVPRKSASSGKFSYNPAGRLPNGVPKGQKHFRDNVTFEVNFRGPGTFTSRTMEVVIYDNTKKILDTMMINWGQLWRLVSQPPSQPDLIISSITVSKYNPHVQTRFTVNVKNIGGTASNQADISVWFWKLNANGSLPATPNEYWEGKVPVSAGGTIGAGATVPWVHMHSNFLVDGNFRIKAKVNQFRTVPESNYNNNEKIYNFTIPN